MPESLLLGTTSPLAFVDSLRPESLSEDARLFACTDNTINRRSCHPILRDSLDTKSVRFFAASERDHQRLVDKLFNLGLTYSRYDRLDPPTCDLFRGGSGDVEIHFRIDRAIRRCVAKYAFNYLAWVAGPCFAQESDFDSLRRFVRYGDMPQQTPVTELWKPILHDDQPSFRQTNGHLITLEWRGGARDLVCEVGLFNYLTYQVTLATAFRGMWLPLRSGHLFDIERHEILRLVGVPSTLMLPRSLVVLPPYGYGAMQVPPCRRTTLASSRPIPRKSAATRSPGWMRAPLGHPVESTSPGCHVNTRLWKLTSSYGRVAMWRTKSR